MMTAKDLRVEPIARADANALVRRVHYSGTVVNNSQLHFGVYIGGRLEGAMQFGPSMDKRKLQGLVRDTQWNGFIELNRLAFSHKLPRNSESRAIGIAFRLMRKAYPQLEWVISFADATQCGDGAIYRAAGFVLTQVKRNTTLWELPNGDTVADITMKSASPQGRDRMIVSRLTAERGKKGAAAKMRKVASMMTLTKGQHILDNGGAGVARLRALGGKPLPGFQMRYVYFLNPAARARLTVPEVPFSKIRELGAAMYLGNKASEVSDRPAPRDSGGVTPTQTLQLCADENLSPLG